MDQLRAVGVERRLRQGLPIALGIGPPLIRQPLLRVAERAISGQRIGFPAQPERARNLVPAAELDVG